MTIKVWRAFEVDPGWHSFTVVVLDDGRKGKPMTVLSDRHGTWHVEEDLYLADLIQPEQRHIEWTVREVSPATVQVPAELLGELGETL